MEITKKLGAIEAILFASGDPIEIYRLSEASGVDVGTIPRLVRLLNERYDDCGSGLCIKKLDSSYQMCTREEFAPMIKTALETKRSTPLSNAAMEALAIIAYKQPITKGQIEHIRGVNSDGCVNRLYERGLIEEKGRLDAPGRPILYVTTDTFLRCFGLTKPTDLPPLDLRSLNLETSQGLQLEIDENGENIAAENEENTEQ